MKKRFSNFVCSLILSLGLFMSIGPMAFAAEGHIIHGVGKFYAQDDDPANVIRRQLQFEAYKNIADQAMKELGLDSPAYWIEYKRQLEEKGKETLLSLRAKYKIGSGGENTPGQKQFASEWRMAQMNLERSFSPIPKMITSIVMRGLTRSAQDPHWHFMNIDGKVDLELLHQSYYQLVGNKGQRILRNLYVSFTPTLQGQQWSEVAVEDQKVLKETIFQNWQQWILRQYAQQVQKITLVSEEEEEKINSYIFSSLNNPNRSNKSRDNSANAPKVIPTFPPVSPSALGTGTSSDLVPILEKDMSGEAGDLPESAWLRVNINVQKVVFQVGGRVGAGAGASAVVAAGGAVGQQQFTYSFNGDVLLYDLRTNSSVYVSDLAKSEEIIDLQNSQEARNKMASAIYNLPLTKFHEVGEKLTQLSANQQSLLLSISPYHSLYNIELLSKMLEEKGISLMVRPVLQSFNKQEAVVLVQFKGGEEKFEQFLRQFSGQRLESGEIISFPDINNLYKIVIENSINPSRGAPKIEEKSQL